MLLCSHYRLHCTLCTPLSYRCSLSQAASLLEVRGNDVRRHSLSNTGRKEAETVLTADAEQYSQSLLDQAKGPELLQIGISQPDPRVSRHQHAGSAACPEVRLPEIDRKHLRRK